MRLAFTADLHYGLSEPGDRSTRALARRLLDDPPDAFVIAGDVAEWREWDACLSLFDRLACRKFLVPGNHCLWSRPPHDPDSTTIYHQIIPATAARHGFWFLDHRPYLDPQQRIALVGSVNWYDYSYASEALEHLVPDIRALYRQKRFPSGAVHLDGRFIRTGMADEQFARAVTETLRGQIESVLGSADHIVAVVHHPPFPELFPAHTEAPNLDVLAWRAYSGNRRMGELLLSYDPVDLIVCGHTHFTRTAVVRGKRCFNIGGDYHAKRLLLVDYPGGAAAWYDPPGEDAPEDRR